MTARLLDPPGPLQVERLANGRRKLLRDLCVLIDDELFKVPHGFVTDFSSWPRWLPGPRFERVDVAGCLHDYAFMFARHGEGGRPIGYWEANRIWRMVARSGDCHVGWLGGSLGWAGLTVGSWWMWWKYRRVEG